MPTLRIRKSYISASPLCPGHFLTLLKVLVSAFRRLIGAMAYLKSNLPLLTLSRFGDVMFDDLRVAAMSWFCCFWKLQLCHARPGYSTAGSSHKTTFSPRLVQGQSKKQQETRSGLPSQRCFVETQSHICFTCSSVKKYMQAIFATPPLLHVGLSPPLPLFRTVCMVHHRRHHCAQDHWTTAKSDIHSDLQLHHSFIPACLTYSAFKDQTARPNGISWL
jgi:hypothetical protein